MPHKGSPSAPNPLSLQQLFQLQHQNVRDLAWSLWGHDLFPTPVTATSGQSIQHMPDELLEPDIQWLSKLDSNPEPLLHFLESKNTRLLGCYFEALWHFYFNHNPSIEASYCNLQIQSEPQGRTLQGRTLGEFDALIKTSAGHHYHLELACKFYLEHEDLWLGPQGKDRLDIKYDRTYQHQLPILHTPEGSTVAQQATQWPTDCIIQQLALWRGCLFSSADKALENEQRDNELLENNLASKQNAWRGQWHNASSFLASQKFKQGHWKIIEKHFWLSPHLSLNKPESNADIASQIEQHFPAKHYALMLVNLTPTPQDALSHHRDTTTAWLETERCLIVADSWPEGHLASRALIPPRPCNPPV